MKRGVDFSMKLMRLQRTLVNYIIIPPPLLLQVVVVLNQ